MCRRRIAVMIDPRYPVGTFTFNPVPTPDTRATCFREIAEAPALLRMAVTGLDDRQLATPYRPGGWTVREVVHHVPDSHLQRLLPLQIRADGRRPDDQALRRSRVGQARRYGADPAGRFAGVARRSALTLGGAAEIHDRGRFRAASPPSRTREDDARLDVAVNAWHGRHHAGHVTELRKREGW